MWEERDRSHSAKRLFALSVAEAEPGAAWRQVTGPTLPGARAPGTGQRRLAQEDRGAHGKHTRAKARKAKAVETVECSSCERNKNNPNVHSAACLRSPIDANTRTALPAAKTRMFWYIQEGLIFTS